MRDIPPLAECFAPDTIASLERAAEQRFTTAEFLRTERRLAALYLYGYTAEICLAAAYFRSAGFKRNQTIDSTRRKRHMAQAKQLGIMTKDPHPIVGWARFLEWQRLSAGNLSAIDSQRLKEAINKGTVIYNYWRPELRYKTVEITDEQINEVRRAAKWLLDNREKL